MKTSLYSIGLSLPVLLLLLTILVCPACAQGHNHDIDTIKTSSDVSAEEQHHSQVDTAHSESGGDTHSTHGGTGGHEGFNIGTILPLWSIIPFLGILLSIALFPLLAPSFWHHHYPKVSIFWALALALPFLVAYKGAAFHEIAHIYLIDYFPFIILLWGLFTVSGGILLRGTLKGTPAVNTLLLLIGTILASWMGTTGAAMLLIRPLIRSNSDRKKKVHLIVFFIFLVANIGGSLTPLGDPPLFLGFIHGVPFFWTLTLFPLMALMVVLLLAIFFIFDTFLYRRENIPVSLEEKVPLKLEGCHNFIFILGILGGVLLSGNWRPGEINILGVHVGIQNLTRDAIIILMGVLSMATTRKRTRADNHFTWEPIKEVAYLFAGIFMTIIPALAMLRAGASGALAFIIDAVKEPYHYFWITGVLSSFLDNAPTYLTFFNLALGRLELPEALVRSILSGMPLDPASVKASVAALGLPAAEAQIVIDSILKGNAAKFVIYLKAISAGAVFFGANTYIGNAPNFMVRSIAEENKINMPSFFGYMVWSIAILCPLFLIVTLIFF